MTPVSKIMGTLPHQQRAIIRALLKMGYGTLVRTDCLCNMVAGTVPAPSVSGALNVLRQNGLVEWESCKGSRKLAWRVLEHQRLVPQQPRIIRNSKSSITEVKENLKSHEEPVAVNAVPTLPTLELISWHLGEIEKLTATLAEDAELFEKILNRATRVQG